MNDLPMPAPPEGEAIAAPAGDLAQFERIGRIVAVTGGHAIVLLDPVEAGLADGEGPAAEIGTLLKVDSEISVALALVSALSAPAPNHEANAPELRIVEVELIGELPKGPDGQPDSFRRGVSRYPSLGDIVCRASQQELAMAYACDANSSVRVGYIQQDKSIPAMVKIDELLGKHFAILGTTGTGKSCSVALILRRILEKNPQAHILLLDVHREYASSFREYANVITPENLNLPFWLLNFEEMVEIVIGAQTNRDQDVEILRELIPQAKLRYMGASRGGKARTLRVHEGVETQNIGVDTPIPYRASDLIALLDNALGKLELKGELAPYKRLKAKIETISRDPRFAFMFGSLTVHDTMTQVIGEIFRVPVDNKPISVLELGGLPSEIINVVVSVLARMAFDFGVWSAGRVPITFVCEEAHRYVPIDKNSGFEPTKRAISRIAKEGRKYGVSLCIVSQRPGELDPTILSQCSTVFSMRLSNERDQEILKAGISDAAASLLEFMPTMGAGEAVTFGEGVALPTRIKFDFLPPECLPKSNTASFSANWSREEPDDGFLSRVVARWRGQSLLNGGGTGDPVNPVAADAASLNPGRLDPPGVAPATQIPLSAQPQGQVRVPVQPAIQPLPPVQAQPPVQAPPAVQAHTPQPPYASANPVPPAPVPAVQPVQSAQTGQIAPGGPAPVQAVNLAQSAPVPPQPATTAIAPAAPVSAPALDPNSLAAMIQRVKG